MGIGRSFQEALHKATQSLEIKRNGLGADGKGYTNYDKIIEKLTNASWDRVFTIYDAIQMGIPLSRIHEITKIDMWFLKQFEELDALEKEISKYKIDTLSRDLLLEAKQKGLLIKKQQTFPLVEYLTGDHKRVSKLWVGDNGYLVLINIFDNIRLQCDGRYRIDGDRTLIENDHSIRVLRC